MSVEWVAGSSWNQWPDVYGIGGRMAVESALPIQDVRDIQPFNRRSFIGM